MGDEELDLGSDYWRFVAYVMGFLAVVAWIIFAVLLGDEMREPSVTPWLWMAGAVTLTVFSAACAVINAVKSMETRLRERITS